MHRTGTGCFMKGAFCCLDFQPTNHPGEPLHAFLRESRRKTLSSYVWTLLHSTLSFGADCQYSNSKCRIFPQLHSALPHPPLAEARKNKVRSHLYVPQCLQKVRLHPNKGYSPNSAQNIICRFSLGLPRQKPSIPPPLAAPLLLPHPPGRR